MAYRLGHGTEKSFSDAALAVGTTTMFTFSSGDVPAHSVGDLLCIEYAARRDITGGTGGGTSTSVLPTGWDVEVGNYSTGPITPTETAIAIRLLWRIADGTSDDYPSIGVSRTGSGTNTVGVYTTAHMFAYSFAGSPTFDSSGSWDPSGAASTTMTTPATGAVLGINCVANFPALTAPSLNSISGHAIQHTSTTSPASSASDSIFTFVGGVGGSVTSPTWNDAVAAVWATFAVDLRTGGISRGGRHIGTGRGIR